MTQNEERGIDAGVPGHALPEITEGGAAQKAGVSAGDRLLAINGHPVLDVIDYQYYIAGKNPELTLLRSGELLKLRVSKRDGEPLGIRFDDMLMDKIRSCKNKCLFCFVDQMPKGCRETLYVKDDDWRLSMLTGSYITLTNVTDAELARIIERKASPLYISVHATEPAVRARLMNNPNAAFIMERLHALNLAGIRFHAQIVLCPEINGGSVLEQTLRDLTGLSACESVAVVPVGLTAHRDGLYPLKNMTADDARRALDVIEKPQFTGKVYASDELYLRAERSLPEVGFYGDFPQIENGVGILRLFEEEYVDALTEVEPPKKERHVVLASGVSSAAFMREMLLKHPMENVTVDVLPIENHFFGTTVTVSGLLTGSDVVRECAGIKADAVQLWSGMLCADGDMFLDGMKIAQVCARLASPVIVSKGGGAGFARALSGNHQ